MLVAKQELAIQVAEIDGVKVDDVDFAKAGENKVLEQFAADAASSYHENARLPLVSILWLKRMLSRVAPS